MVQLRYNGSWNDEFNEKSGGHFIGVSDDRLCREELMRRVAEDDSQGSGFHSWVSAGVRRKHLEKIKCTVENCCEVSAEQCKYVNLSES